MRHHRSISLHQLHAEYICSDLAKNILSTASIGQDGSQMCPRCEAPLQDWVSLQAAQQHSSLATYFRSVEGVLAELTQAMRVRLYLSASCHSLKVNNYLSFPLVSN